MRYRILKNDGAWELRDAPSGRFRGSSNTFEGAVEMIGWDTECEKIYGEMRRRDTPGKIRT